MQPQSLIPQLRVRSTFSLAGGIMQPADLAKAAADKGIPALALTDTGNWSGIVQFIRHCIGAGVQPIAGVELRFSTANIPASPLVFLAKNITGGRNLMRIISHSEASSLAGKPRLDIEYLTGLESAKREGLIVLSGGQFGVIKLDGTPRSLKEGTALCEQLREAFTDNFYLEISRVGRHGESHYVQRVVELGEKQSIPVVATGDVSMGRPDDFEKFSAKVCIEQGERLMQFNQRGEYSDKQYLHSSAEMSTLFNDLPATLDNAVTIAKSCGRGINLTTPQTPKFPTTDNLSEEATLRQFAEKGLQDKFVIFTPAKTKQKDDYIARLNTELSIIENMGFSGYFLIVADFVNWAKDNDVSVGPGRGSGAGSLVSWALGITGPDPIEYGLIFERFLNPERLSMPDFDIDFDPVGRESVINYVVEKYGTDHVAQIGTFGTLGIKSAIHDATRIMGYDSQVGRRITKILTPEADSFEKARELLPTFVELSEGGDEAVIIALAEQLEGMVRNFGLHAAGLVISDQNINDYAPLFYQEESQLAFTQFDKDDVESVGLVKFDFLGLKTLKTIDIALESINRERLAKGEKEVEFDSMGMADEAVFKSISNGNCTGIFQLEGGNMQEIIEQFEVQNFSELAALLALIRPGPLGARMYHQAVKVKKGEAEMEMYHEKLRTVLEETWGVLIFQEQVMELGRVLLGYSYAQADELRRVMGKKDQKAMDELRVSFVKLGVEKSNLNNKLAEHIFDDVSKFAGYGFNKSHSVSYAYISYQTAWLRHYYPEHFFAAFLTTDSEDHDRVRKLIVAGRLQNIEFLPPNVNHSKADSYGYANEDSQRFVQLGLGLLKQVGVATAENIASARELASEYKDLYEFTCRTEMHNYGSGPLRALIYSGALDDIIYNRHTAIAEVDRVIQASAQYSEALESNQGSLFGETGTAPMPSAALQQRTEYPYAHLAEKSREVYGFHLRDHPLKLFEQDMQHLGTTSFAALKSQPNGLVCAVCINPINRNKDAKQQQWNMLLENDLGERLDATYYPKGASQSMFVESLQTGDLVRARIECQERDFDGIKRTRYRIVELISIQESRKFAQGIGLTIKTQHSSRERHEIIQVLKSHLAALSPEIAPLYLQVEITLGAICGSIILSDGQNIGIKDPSNLQGKLYTLNGVKSVGINYNPI